MKTKPFNKERAIAGDPVVDTTGQRWEFVEDDGSDFLNLHFKNIGEGYVCYYHDNGKYFHDGDSMFDLSMLDATP